MGFEKATKHQGPQLSTYLGAARAKRMQRCGDDAKKAYEIVANFLDSNSDGSDLPFWNELQEGLALSGDCEAEEQNDGGSSQEAVSVVTVLAVATLTYFQSRDLVV